MIMLNADDTDYNNDCEVMVAVAEVHLSDDWQHLEGFSD